MKNTYFLIIAFLFISGTYAQTVTNGNFNTGTTGWSCNPEVNTEVVYGGPSATNLVAEVDAQAGLCQTITGFTVGSYYNLSFLCSRRTSCGPTLQTMTVTMSGGVINKNVSRNGTAFSLTTETVSFYATSTSHTLTFTGTTTETCNLLVDNIQITLISGLPVELSSFSATCLGDKVTADWTTESESRSDYFTLQRSEDGLKWKDLAEVKAQLNSQSQHKYSFTDNSPFKGQSYYRLQLTNTDGTKEMLSATAVKCDENSQLVYPNPVTAVLNVSSSEETFKGLYDAVGRPVQVNVSSTGNKSFQLDLSGLPVGIYYVHIGDAVQKVLKQ